MKKLLYLFALWVVMSDNTVYKYPQASYWQNGRSASNYKQETFELVEAMTNKVVIVLPKYKVMKVVYKKPKEAKSGYHVYWNCQEGFSHKPYEDSEVIIRHGVRMIIENRSTYVGSDSEILGEINHKH